MGVFIFCGAFILFEFFILCGVVLFGCCILCGVLLCFALVSLLFFVLFFVFCCFFDFFCIRFFYFFWFFDVFWFFSVFISSGLSHHFTFFWKKVENLLQFIFFDYNSHCKNEATPKILEGLTVQIKYKKV